MKKALFCAKTLSAVIILSLLLNLFGTAAFASSHSVGDLIQFGSYPQNLCEDEEILSQLKQIEKDWKYYDYYGGNGEPGSMEKGHYNLYADISYNGKKYRAFYIEEFRPSYTTSYKPVTGTWSNLDYQDIACALVQADTGNLMAQGYTSEKIYYFEYEPVWWKVLDPSTGLVVSCDILDAQPFNNNLYWVDKDGDGSESYDENYEYFGDKSGSSYANNWENSSIREWLNDDFYNTAFTDSEQNKIKKTQVDNTNIVEKLHEQGLYFTYYQSEKEFAEAYACGYTQDKVFLLSANEVITEKYGFENYLSSESDTRRADEASDYARAQGLALDDTSGTNSLPIPTLLRSPDTSSSMEVDIITSSGGLGRTTTHDTGHGIRPAMTVDLSSLTAYSGGDGSYSDDDGGYIADYDDYNSNDSYYEDNGGDDNSNNKSNDTNNKTDSGEWSDLPLDEKIVTIIGGAISIIATFWAFSKISKGIDWLISGRKSKNNNEYDEFLRAVHKSIDEENNKHK